MKPSVLTIGQSLPPLTLAEFEYLSVKLFDAHKRHLRNVPALEKPKQVYNDLFDRFEDAND